MDWFTSSGEDSDEAVIWIDSAGLWIMAPSGQALVLGGLQDQGRLVRCETERGPVATTPRRPASDGTMNLSPGTGVLLPLKDVDQVQLNLALTSGAMPAERIVTGAYREKTQEEGSLVATRGLLWLLPFLVVQLGLVALPEEWFFRGYLQGRMDQRWGTPWRLAGASIGPGLLVAALFFALLHPILIPGAHRLLVFFPALLFGWLKARNGHIGAAMVVHAGSNLLLEVLTGMYG